MHDKPLPDGLVAAVRTGIAALVGLLAGWLLTKGIEVPEDIQVQLTGFLMILATGVYNAAVIWLERNVSPLFGLLLGVPRTPAYAGVAPKPAVTFGDQWHLREPPVEHGPYED